MSKETLFLGVFEQCSMLFNKMMWSGDLTSEEQSLVDDLGEHNRIAISMPLGEHMDHWYNFYRFSALKIL